MKALLYESLGTVFWLQYISRENEMHGMTLINRSSGYFMQVPNLESIETAGEGAAPKMRAHWLLSATYEVIRHAED